MHNSSQGLQQTITELISAANDELKAQKLQNLLDMCSTAEEVQLMDAVMQLSYLEVDTSIQVRKLWCAFLVQASVCARNQIMLFMARECCERLFEDEDDSVAFGALLQAGLLVIGGIQYIIKEKDKDLQNQARQMVSELLSKLVEVAQSTSSLSRAIYAVEECKQLAITLTASQVAGTDCIERYQIHHQQANIGSHQHSQFC
eukprot:TRINITY_DN81281_c0_g1_i1.p1 TRINITY_DN81281_c0_g1~~TRINITY_DN81281_c0_g1_i1.p1  ORF type:complete len:215 (-),score=19.86 TRINITY_DN81281_c0_g1_i1:224-829(-)